MSGIQAKTVIKYAVMPGIIPRLKALFTSGFGYIAFLMAQIYATVRLLPADHPYLNPQNINRYGIRHVIAESANALVISKKNIDQIIIFILMLTGVVILGLQLATLAFSLLFGPALAGGGGFSLFITQNPNFDIAFMLLDQVFGVGDGTAARNFFNSCVAQSINCDPNAPAGATAPAPFPWPFHIALRNLFRFYSLGILLIGTIIFLYFVLVIVVETATTGTPFGQRFKNVWVPIRLVVAIGLLIPLSFGYNSGQYITFAAAKYGSGLATNAWTSYNAMINAEMSGQGNPIGERENLIAMPKPPDAAVMAEFMSIIHACNFAHYLHSDKFVNGSPPSAAQRRKGAIRVDYPELESALNGGTLSGGRGTRQGYLSNNYAVKPYFVKTPTEWQTRAGGLAADSFHEVTDATTYDEAYEFYTAGDIIIRFGRQGHKDLDGNGSTSEYEEKLYGTYSGSVEPTCGEIRIPVTDRRPTTADSMHSPAGGSTSDGFLGTVAVQRMYFLIVRDHWHNFSTSENYIDFAGRIVLLADNSRLKKPKHNACAMGCRPAANQYLPNGGSCGNPPASAIAPDTRACATADISARWKQNAINVLQTEINAGVTGIWQAYNLLTNEFRMDTDLLQYGWGGAGIWFNTLAKVNGAFVTALMDFPSMTTYPMIMKTVAEDKDKKDKDPSGFEQFNPIANEAGGEIELTKYGSGGKAIAIAEYDVIAYWNTDNKNMAKIDKTLTSGALETGMNLVFGTYGLLAMTSENANIHPLSQLVALGKGLVESAIRNVAGSSMAAAMGGMASAVDTSAGPLVNAASGFLMGTAFVGLTAGFVLFYVLPFLPFVYFFFAVASWIKTIFEAMVGVPLWALAHLRLDGDGLPGESAANGYFLIFEIFIRPILSIAGLVAAMVIFTAQVRILNFTWSLVTENAGGHNSDSTIGIIGNVNFKRSIIDEFFYTVLYAIIVYMLATSSFKLIDKIPDNILRWMGQGVSSFGDINQDPTESLTRYAALGGMTAGRQAAGGIKDLAGGMGGAFGKEFSGVGKMGGGPK